MIELYINNKKVDIDHNTTTNITYSLSDINNPTTIKSDYTKSIELPMTENNKLIFGYLNRLDSSSLLYNASKRYNCILLYNGDIVIKGYIKLEEITDTFSVVIYGQLGEFFKSLEDKKIVEISTKIKDLTHTLNRDFIKSNWEHENDINGESIHDYISYGFGYNGIYDNFNNSSVQVDVSSNHPNTPENELDDKIFIDNPEDVDEHQMKLYMSYAQRRGFYVNKLFKSIIDNSGYSIDYSKDFFNNENPYWKDTVVFFNKEKTIEKESLNFYCDPIEKVIDQSVDIGISSIIEDIPFNKSINNKYLDSNGYLNLDLVDVSFSHLSANYDVDIIIDEIKTSGIIKAKNNSLLTNSIICNVKNLIYKDIEINDYDQISYNSSLIPDLKFDVGNGVIVTYDETPLTKNMIINQVVNPNDIIIINNKFQSKMAYIGNNGSIRFKLELNKLVEGLFTNLDCRIRVRINSINLDLTDELTYRSGVTVTAQQILGNNTTQKDFILNYMKMFDLHLVLDKNVKKGKILTRNEFYKDYKIYDWDKFINDEEELNIIPVTFDTKYLSYRYKEGNTNYDKQYKDVWDRYYGESRVDTGYEFNDNPINCINSIFSPPIIAQDNSWEFKNRFRNGSTRDDKIMMYSCNKKGNVRERVDNGIQIYFRNGLLPCCEYQITDDTKDMIKLDKYCHNWTFKDGKVGEAWCDGINKVVNGTKQFYYRQFSSINRNNTCSLDFRKPSEIFYEGMYPNSIGLYDLFWSGYVEDKYNVDNKLITAKFVVNKYIILNFTFNTFIYLGGQYWSVSRIIDFDPKKDESVLVELVQIKNINNYINSQKMPWLINK